MWRASVGLKPVVPPKPSNDDDWETDPDFINNVSEKESRWGAKTVEGSGHQESIRLDQLRDQVLKSDREIKEKQTEHMPKASYGYGGSFGIEKNRQDQSALDWSTKSEASKHSSQTDGSKGFGGQYGVQTDRQDKSAQGWSKPEPAAKHESQNSSRGFGGKFGIETDRQDKSAQGWSKPEPAAKHESQNSSRGFGGKFGVETDRQDKSALGWDKIEKVQPHESQLDYKKGFGGQFGVQKDRMDKSAVGWQKPEPAAKHASQTDGSKGFGGKFGLDNRQDKAAHSWNEQPEKQSVAKDEIPRANASNLRNKFEQLAMQQQDDKVQQERERRKREDDELRRRGEETERLRQQQIEEQHSKMPESHDNYEEPAAQAQRSRASIGVRLPIAPQNVVEPAVQEFDHSHQEHLSEPDTYESVPAEPEPTFEAPRVQVLPSSNKPFGAGIPRRQSSNDEEDNWDENPEPTVFKLPATQTNFPEEPHEPTPTLHVHNNNTVYSASPPHQPTVHSHNNNTVFSASPPKQSAMYDYVPEPPTQSHQLSHSVLQSQPSQEMYDYVPDEPPAMQANLVQRHDLYEEPPTEQANLVRHDLYEEPPVETEPQVPHQASGSSGLTAIALYEYEKQDDDEISFDVNDVITNIEQVDAGWWRGMCKNFYGLFPSNYVQLQQ